MDAGDYDTNTLIVNNLSSIAYRIYEPVATTSSPYTFHASDVECALRNDGHLVYMDAERKGVWCFYLVGKDAATTSGFMADSRLGTTLDVCGYHLQLVTQGTFEPSHLLKNRPTGQQGMNSPQATNSPGGMGSGGSVKAGQLDLMDTKGYKAVPVIQMHGFFVNSMLSSLCTAFCRVSGAISLTKRTVLLPTKTLEPRDGEPSRYSSLAALATFRIYLTTMGSLVINLAVTAVEDLLSAADSLRLDLPTSSGASVLAAPIGAFATAQSIMERDIMFPDHISSQTPETQVTRYRTDISSKIGQWKVLLDLHGISPSILEGCSWINLQSLRRNPQSHGNDSNPMISPAPIVYAWPSVLCFRKRNPNLLLGRGADQRAMSMETGNDYDPLTDARDWFERTAEREELSAQRRKKEQQESAMKQAAEGDGRSQHPNMSSPVALTRTGNTGTTAASAAAGAMYPTPPDGVQLPSGVASSIDGTISSPPVQSSVAAVADSDVGHTVHSDGLLDTSFPGDWDAVTDHTQHTDSEHRRDRHSNATLFESGENVFGDLGDDPFENNELTDADFDNYFDQVSQGPDNGHGLPMPASHHLDMRSELEDINMDDALDLATDMALEQAAANTSQNTHLSTETPLVAPPSPVFAKPELRHARSTLGSEASRHQQINTASYEANAATGTSRKRAASPFDPRTVYKRVRASLSGPSVEKHLVADTTTPRRRSSVFEKMDFDTSLSQVAKKYRESGPYQFSLPSPKSKDEEFGTELELATVPKVRRYCRKKEKPTPSSAMQYGDLMERLTASLQNNSLNRNAARPEDAGYDDGDSFVSDQDDGSSQGSGGPSSPTRSTATRTRLAEDDNMSMAGSFKDMEHGTAMPSPLYTTGDLSTLPQPGEPEVSVTKYFSEPEPWPLQLSCSDEVFVTVAQILTEQAVSGSLRLGLGGTGTYQVDSALQETRRNLAIAARYSIQCLHSVLPSSLSSASECLFKPFIEIQDVPVVAQPTKMQPRPVGQEPPTRPSLFQIATPHVEVRRNDAKLSVLPSAVTFWESLGLSPSQGTKDISAICVYSDFRGMKDNMTWFLESIRSSYESLKMGSFEGLSSSSITKGLCPYTIDGDAPTSPYAPTTPRLGPTVLAAHMTNLAQELAIFPEADRNFVVYFVYDPRNPISAVEACLAFHDLFEKYEKALADRKKAAFNELVLQLIPMDMVASETCPVVLTPTDYIKLCIETYDRCTLFGGSMPAPAIVLEHALPSRVEFRTTTNPPAHVLHENSCIHIAYARSVDDRWITAAWTDNTGTKQMTASYCLGRRGKRLSTALADVMHEIWETTHDLTSIWKVHWRVMVAKSGPMDQTEIDCWRTLAQNETKTSVSLSLLTVDTNPSLQLIPPLAKIPVNIPSLFYTTPVSTPGPVSTVSPEQTSTPAGSMFASATPSGGDNPEPEADTTLIDATEITWGAVMSHRLNNSTSLTDLHPALQSGYLVKRSSSRAEDAPVLMEVNLVYTSECNNNPRAFETLLREVLIYYRGLGTLARLRGVVDRETDVRPWHVAAAEKGVGIVYALM